MQQRDVNMQAMEGPFEVKNNHASCSALLYCRRGQWSEKENIRYYAFVKRFQDKFEGKERREWKIFKTLAQFMRTRSASQCRSHHHQVTKDYASLDEALAFLCMIIPELDRKSVTHQQALEKVCFNNASKEAIQGEKHDPSNERTGLTYENEPPNQQYQQHQEPSQHQNIVECHEMFVRWWDRLSSLMERECQ